jgi:hypothetical protein
VRASRLRLRFVPGVTLTAATYGSSTYGGPITYGQRATDPVPLFRYRVVPLPAGAPTMPAWIYRQGDRNPPLRAQVLGDDSAPLNLSAVVNAQAVLTPYDERTLVPYNLPMTIVGAATNGTLSHAWVPTDRLDPGNYRVTILMMMQSTRRFVLPGDDQLRLVVVPVS